MINPIQSIKKIKSFCCCLSNNSTMTNIIIITFRMTSYDYSNQLMNGPLDVLLPFNSVHVKFKSFYVFKVCIYIKYSIFTITQIFSPVCESIGNKMANFDVATNSRKKINFCLTLCIHEWDAGCLY